MEELASSRFEGIGNTVRKRRSHTFRRPRPELRPICDGHDIPSLSSTPPLDENTGCDHSSKRKELSLSQCASKFPVVSGSPGEKPIRKTEKLEVALDELYDNSSSRDGTEEGRSGSNKKRSSEGVLAPANCKSSSRIKESLEPQKTVALNSRKGDESSGPSLDGSGNDNKLKKFKFKVGGVTRTIDANSFTKTSHSSVATVSRQKLVDKDGSEVDNPPPTEKRVALKGVPWKDFSRGGFSLRRDDNSSMGKTSGRSQSGKQGDNTNPVRKSRRAPKKRAVDGFDDDNNDDEIRYLEKLRNAKVAAGFRDDSEESSRKHRRLSKFSGTSQNMEGNSSQSGKDGKKKSPSEDIDYEEEDEPLSEGEPEGQLKKKTRKDIVDSSNEPTREMTLTTRQRALQSGRDGSAPGGGVVEFPNGLPLAPPRKQKEKLSEVEQQLKKAEAAQRRRMLNEKAARESEAEAIRKILGQDSNRKKREEKKKKREEELVQEKAADERMRASNSIRVVMGPNGTTVTFPNEVGLPIIFNSKPCSYPPLRETCAGPSCTNPYKYRDSKTKLPLCSLQCYRAVQGKVLGETSGETQGETSGKTQGEAYASD